MMHLKLKRGLKLDDASEAAIKNHDCNMVSQI